jgi:glycine betaine/proline transport system ATP-binding protein
MRTHEELVREGEHLWLDTARRYQVTLDARGACRAVRVDGIESAFAVHDADNGALGAAGEMMIASISLPLHRLIRLRQASGHPVLLAEDGVISGVCDENEIVRALAGKTTKSN